ncbi:colicin immunity domain-containing protein [Pseudomonas maumuensis]|uniref:Colicin D immunity protein domain-containing protein n=1 Tax=Pseudomonas maumuensis TaxID=2842354 RepID=A0ABX8NRM0_9PSED|nr:colicin immunity domain-containing protein [Pseudomonas maumuensis]QXH58678.1 hypothetical protein KSS90_10900 [Pseudomonas maumuensis]
MSMVLIDLAKSFIRSEITADTFEAQFFEIWYQEGTSGLLAQDSQEIKDCLNELFDFAERYTSDADKKDYELDQEALSSEIKKTLTRCGLL